MRARPLRQREKLFYEIINSINEYSTEDQIDWEAAEPIILKLLESYRPIKLVDYQYGISNVLKKDHRLIVKEENDKTKVREYSIFPKSNVSWICSRKGSNSVNCNAGKAKFKYGILFASIAHNVKCEPKDYEFVMKVQCLLKKGRKKEALQLLNSKRKFSSTSSKQILPSLKLKKPPKAVVAKKESVVKLERSTTNHRTPIIHLIYPQPSPADLRDPSSSSALSEAVLSSDKIKYGDYENNGANIKSEFSTYIDDSNSTTHLQPHSSSSIPPDRQNSSTVVAPIIIQLPPHLSTPSDSTQRLSSSTHLETSSAITSIKTEIQNDEYNDDCMIIKEPIAKRPKIELSFVDTVSVPAADHVKLGFIKMES